MILVIGATGQLGGLITRTLLTQGRDVRIFVRPTSDYHALVQAGAQLVIGDLKDPASLDPACAGVDTVITTANSAARGGSDNAQTVDLEGNRHLINAAKAARVSQFVFTSVFGVALDSPVPFLQAKARTEAYLRESGMPYTILAPDVFMDVWFPMIIGQPLHAGQPITLIGEGRHKHSFIAMADVAAFAIAAIDHAAAVNQQLPLGGPEALAWREVIAITEQVLGRPIPVHTVDPGEPAPGLPDLVVGLMTGMEMYDSVINMTETARTFGVNQVSVEAFMHNLFAKPQALTQ